MTKPISGERGTNSFDLYKHSPCLFRFWGSHAVPLNLSSYTQLCVAFFLSAILHFSTDFVCGKRIATHSFKPFLLQPVVVAFENLFIYIANRLLRREE